MRLSRFSVRTRLTLWHAGVLALVICVFSAGIFLFVRTALYGNLDQQLGRELTTVERVYREDPGELGELDPRMGFSLFEVIDGGKIVHQTQGWERLGFASAAAPKTASRTSSWTSSEPRAYRIAVTSGPSYQIVVARDESALRNALQTLAIILVIGLPCAVAMSVAGGYLLAGRVLSPIATMADTTRRITADSLGERLPVENPQDELGRLAAVVNEMLARVHGSFEQLRRFTADASHELRTPLTAMRSVGEVALQNPLDLASYRDVIGSMLEEVDRLTRLVETLLTLTRGESGRIALNREVVNLGALATSVAEQLRVLAEEKQQTLSVLVETQINVDCDPTILRQALTNVLHNAIKYTPDKGSICVRVTKGTRSKAAIEIEDTGSGISTAHHEQIFERFYRVDQGRSQEAGGIGLGLAIARWAVEANEGRIELESEPGKGSTFRIVLPDARAT